MVTRIKKLIKNPDFASYVLFFACWTVYAVACFGRNAFSSANAAIAKEGLFSKDSLGLIGAGFYLFYSAGQLVGGRLVDKTSPEKLVSIGLIAGIVSSLIIANTENFYVILVSWCLNGLLQFAIFPASISVISTRIHKDFRRKALTYFAFTTPIGVLFSYLVSSILLKNNRWTSIFTSIAVVTVACLALWYLLTKKYSTANFEHEQKSVEKVKESVPWKKLVAIGLIPMSIGAFIKSTLDLGVKAWIPTILMETYDLSASFSIFLTIFMVILNISGVFIADYFLKKFKGNEIKVASLLFLLSMPFIAGLLFMKYISLYSSVFFMSIFTTLMGANAQILLMYIPVRFTKYGCVGTVTGILNACASFGTFLSTYVFGLTAEYFGWTVTISIWIVLTFVGFLIFALTSHKWKNFIKTL